MDGILDWVADKTSPGIRRAHITESQLQDVHGSVESYTALPFTREYLAQCDQSVRDFFQKNICPPSVRQITSGEVAAFNRRIDIAKKNFHPRVLQRRQVAQVSKPAVSPISKSAGPGNLDALSDAERQRIWKSATQQTAKSALQLERKPLVFVQYGTGCPMMDGMHIKVAESWGADGVLHFDPAWGARTEGLMDGFLTNAEDGTPVTYANLSLIKRSLDAATLWTVRAHRGLNTPEIAVLSGFLGADMSKINIGYGSICGGTDPARLTVDGVEAMRIAVRYKMPFDIPTNEELAGVPPHKAFAGMLIMAQLGRRLGAKPILKPLLCHGPYIMVQGLMDQNYVDYNFAKIRALQAIADFPIWPGEPIGFMTHTEEKEQSATTTSLHAAMCCTLGVDAITTASTDEAFSRGPITADGRVGSLRSMEEAFRFFGETDVAPSTKADEWQEDITTGINRILKAVAEAPSFVEAIYSGLLGNKDDGVYPGRAGKNSVIAKTHGNGILKLPPAPVRKKPVLTGQSPRPIARAARRRR